MRDLHRGPLGSGPTWVTPPETHPKSPLSTPTLTQLTTGSLPSTKPDLLVSEGATWQRGCSVIKSGAQVLVS